MPDVNGHGGSQFNLAYLNALVEEGIQVTVLHLRSISPRRRLYQESQINGVKRISVSCYTPPVLSLVQVYFFPSLFRYLLRNRPFDFNIIHGVGGGTVVASKIMSELGSAPFFLQFIGGDINVNLEKDIKYHKYVEALKSAAFVGFNSKKLETDFFGKSKLKVNSQVVYRGVDLKKFDFDYPITTELRILFLGGVPRYNEKGAFTMVDLCNTIIDKPISSNKIIIKLGGPNIEKILPVLTQIDTSKISIQVLGAIDRDEVKRQMKISNIVIIPSISEGMPNVLFEAMATGNIIIATDVGGIPEFITNGVTGFLVKRQSAVDIIQILKMLDTSTDNLKIAVAARRLIEKYSYQSFINFYVNKYLQTINSSNYILDSYA